MGEITDKTNISDTALLGELKENLIKNYINTIGDLKKISVVELLSLGNISIYDVQCIKDVLNPNGYHLIGEELIEFKDFYNAERNALLNHCQVLIDQRNRIRGKEGFQAEEYALCEQIFYIFEQVRVLREQKKNTEESILVR